MCWFCIPYQYHNKEESEIKKNYSEMPDEVSRILTDESISLIDRIKYAEDRKSERWYSCDRVMNLVGVPSTTFNRYLQVIRANNDEIYHRVATGKLRVTMAADLLKQMDYPFRNRLERMGASIIYIGSRHVIYEYHQCCYLGIAYPAKERNNELKVAHYLEKLYRIDNEPYAVDTIIKLINDGYSIGKTLLVRTPDRKPAGTLRHYIYAAYHKADLNLILNERVELDFNSAYSTGTETLMDLRISNLSGPLDKTVVPISGWTAVMRRGKDIVITRKAGGLVTYTDFSPELYRVLNDYGALHTKADDNRLCLLIDSKHDIYLYHLRMIEHLYGLPHDTEGLIANIERFRDEYLRQGMVVDHIDNDCTNDRLSNLMLMSLENNNVKSAIMRAIKKLGYPFFCWAERYDDTAITLQAGYFSQFKRPRYMVEGVFTVKQFLAEAQNFVDCAREECAIYDEFERLERKEEEKQK